MSKLYPFTRGQKRFLNWSIKKNTNSFSREKQGYWERSETGELTVFGNINVGKVKGATRIPLQFSTVKGTFNLNDCKDLSSLVGCPKQLIGAFYLSRVPKLKSLHGITPDVSGDLHIELDQITSMQGIHKLINRVGGRFRTSAKTHLLGILLIPEHTYAEIDIVGEWQLSKLLTSARKKINSGEWTIFDAQEMLIQAGFTDAARL